MMLRIFFYATKIQMQFNEPTNIRLRDIRILNETIEKQVFDYDNNIQKRKGERKRGRMNKRMQPKKNYNVKLVNFITSFKHIPNQ